MEYWLICFALFYQLDLVLKFKTEQEKVKLNFKSQNNEIYNKDFNLDE